MGRRAFEAQFQQCPVLEGAGVIDLGDICRYDELPKEYDARFLSIDAASGLEGISYSVILGCQITNGRLYVFAHYRDKPTIPDLARTVLNAHRDMKIDHLVIENKSGGEALIQLIDEYFRRKTGDIGHWRHLIKRWNPNVSKMLRMEKQLRHVQAGRLWFPRDKPWLSEFERELRNFPAGKFDDQVDALSQALDFFTWYMNHPGYGRRIWPRVA